VRFLSAAFGIQVLPFRLSALVGDALACLKRQSGIGRNFLHVIGMIVIARLASGLALGLLAGIAQAAESGVVPDFEAVRAAHRPSDVWMLDRNGLPMQRLRRDDTVRRLDWVALDQVSPSLQAALLTAEDKRFHEHGGVDWAAAAQAAWDKLRSSAGATHKSSVARGASTLSMQLAALLDPALRPASGRRDLGQKWDQARAAWTIEERWTKAQIFEAYLNLVPLRGESVGLPAASEVWFGKRPEGLDLTESALLAALIRQPQASPARVGERACRIMVALDEQQLPASVRPTCEDIRARAISSFNRPQAVTLGPAMAPHAARVLRGELNASNAVKASSAPNERDAAPPYSAAKPRSPPALRTTLDAGLQSYASERLGQHLRELAGRNVEDGAVVVLDNASGEVLAWVGSSGGLSDAAAVDGVLALRQAGSTLKPFLYGLAFDRQLLTAASLIDDSPVALTAENGVYVPQNYDRHFRGWVSTRTALASSLNIPAVRVLLATGNDRFYERLKRFGFTSLTESADYYGLALALGSAEIRLLDLANAYRALANLGLASPVAPLLSDPTRKPSVQRASSERVMGAGAAFIVGDILADRGARAPAFGLENPLATRVWSAVKTGTSKDMRDNWAVGFTSRYTVAVWVGNFSGAPMWNVSGVQGAAPLWRDLVHFLHEREPSRAPKPPPGLERVAVAFADIEEAARPEWFIAGTAMSQIVRAETVATRPRITYPAEGLIVALDPDIPPELERLPLRMQPARPGFQWLLVREVAGGIPPSGRGPSCTLIPEGDQWAPEPGAWTLRLIDSSGEAVDSVRFSVRGIARVSAACAASAEATNSASASFAALMAPANPPDIPSQSGD